MVAHSQSQQNSLQKGKRLSSSPIGTRHHPKKQSSQDTTRRLQDILRQGAIIESDLWSFSAQDWIISVSALDIDNDGDIEILIGSRDGYVRALTRRGALKWETLLKEPKEIHQISALCALILETASEGQPRIFVGTRRGKILALDAAGNRVSNWKYDTERMIRQIFINPNDPEKLIIASEDRTIHVIDRKAHLLSKYPTNGWIRCVFSCDINGDGQTEILAGSGDKHLYILDHEGSFLKKFFIGHQITALFAAQLEKDGPMKVIISSNRNDLSMWSISRSEKKGWQLKREWGKSPEAGLFENRVHSICVANLDKGPHSMILAGSEDGHLYILNHQGTLLWKHFFGSCIYSVCTADINFDGHTEILVGTESNLASVIHLDLTDTTNTYQQIKNAYKTLIRTHNHNEIIKGLSLKERALLNDIIKKPARKLAMQGHAIMEMDTATELMEQGNYEEALKIFLRLLQQRVQYYWAQPIKTTGYIWTECFGNVCKDAKKEIILGTDEGLLYAIAINEQGEERIVWKKDLGSRVRSIQTGGINPNNGYDSIVAILADNRILVIDNEGEIVKQHSFKDKEDWARSVYITKSDENDRNTVREIVIGLENKKVIFWDTKLEQQTLTIDTSQGVSVVMTHDINGDGEQEIITGSINNLVCAYDKQGKELWSFPTQDRVEMLHISDIDKDGHVEIIAGSSDRNVYVLDHKGHLRWRYRTLRGVMDIDVCDIKLENDPEDEQERKQKVLVGSADGNVYVLNADGDQIWTYESSNRIRSVRAQDLDLDGNFELAVASEDRLELLQFINRPATLKHIEYCWEKLFPIKNDRERLLKFTHHKDEYIRGYAIARLAGQHTRNAEDFIRFRDAVRDDDSLQVKRELVRAVIVLYRVPYSQEENRKQARWLLRQLSSDPAPEIRLAIVDVLPLIMKMDKSFCFEYLDDFTYNVDIWVRRAVVRQLHKGVTEYPQEVFPLLLKTAVDPEEWVRQETGRALAHYFDVQTQQLVQNMLKLIQKRVDPAVLQQIAYSSQLPPVQHVFEALVTLLRHLNAQNLEDVLEEVILVIKEVNATGTFFGQELLEVYEEFLNISQVRAIDDIALCQRTTRRDLMADLVFEGKKHIINVFDALEEVGEIIKVYQRREAMGDRATSLLAAIDNLENIRTELKQEELKQTQKLADSYPLPEDTILTIVLDKWSKIIKAELALLRGDAKLSFKVLNAVIWSGEESIIALQITNKGRSPADNIYVVLQESNDYSIIGPSQQILSEVSTSTPETLLFKIKPYGTSLWLPFHYTYDDAERRERSGKFADILFIQEPQYTYRTIPNHYTSGMPIKDRHMFYGRQEELDELREKLKGFSANKVVVLLGQRRMGKTSLLYRITNELAKEAYTPALIDLQALSLTTNIGQFLHAFAARIQDEIWHYKKVRVKLCPIKQFHENPTAAFDSFLAEIFHLLKESRLVLLIDEFERMGEHHKKGTLNDEFLNYLRSLMQHQQGLSFLLAGTPQMLSLTNGYWAIFFNIATYQHLKKLKQREAIALITEPIAGFLAYDPFALERILALTGSQPYLIHVMSEQVIAYCNAQKKPYATISDINFVLDIVLEEQTNSVQWIWDEYPSFTEHLLLSLLAQEKGQEGRVFTTNDIHMEYKIQRIPFEGKAIAEALSKLVLGGVLEERNAAGQYRIPVGLIKEWLRRAKSPARVIQEEKYYETK